MEKKYFINGQEVTVQDFTQDATAVSFSLHGKKFQFNRVYQEGPELILEQNGRFKAQVSSRNREGEATVMTRGREAVISLVDKKRKAVVRAAGGLTSPMPGKIFKILKARGDEVKKGDPILILEAMKMEHAIRSDKDGKIKQILFKEGELVQGGVTLAEVE